MSLVLIGGCGPSAEPTTTTQPAPSVDEWTSTVLLPTLEAYNRDFAGPYDDHALTLDHQAAREVCVEATPMVNEWVASLEPLPDDPPVVALVEELISTWETALADCREAETAQDFGGVNQQLREVQRIVDEIAARRSS